MMCNVVHLGKSKVNHNLLVILFALFSIEKLFKYNRGKDGTGKIGSVLLFVDYITDISTKVKYDALQKHIKLFFFHFKSIKKTGNAFLNFLFLCFQMFGYKFYFTSAPTTKSSFAP